MITGETLNIRTTSKTMSQRSTEFHKQVRQYRSPAFAEFMDSVYLGISEADRDLLPINDSGAYVNAIVTFALKHLPDFSEAIAEMVAGVYAQNPGGERFVLDPTRCDEITESILYLDVDGHLVTVKNVELQREEASKESIGVLIMKRYQSYEVLTGPLLGKRYDSYSRPLPLEPTYRPGVILGDQAAAFPLAGGVNKIGVSENQSGLQVFLCHASEDKDTVQSLYKNLQQSGFHPWLDKEDLLPGQDWDIEITKAIKRSHIVLVCLSRYSEKRGYLQKEFKRALDVADEMPEGATFLIPVRIEDCIVPDRLKRWQWVDIFKEDGYTKLEVALKRVQNSL